MSAQGVLDQFFEVLHEGKAVKLRNPPKQQSQQCPWFSVQVLNAYQSDAAITADDWTYVYSRCLLPMMLFQSPVYLWLKYEPKDSKTWQQGRYENSITVFYTLRGIINCFGRIPSMPVYQAHSQRCQAAYNTYMVEVEGREERLFEEVAAIQRAFVGGQVNEREALWRFLQTLEIFTLNMINIAEKAVMTILDLKNIPLSQPVFPEINQVPRQQLDQLLKESAVFFKAKEDITNTRLEKAAGGDGSHFVTKTFFNMDNYNERIPNTRQDELYRGYIDRTTAWEYFKFMDIEEILGN